LDPINEQKKTIDSQILLLESYNKEYQDYSMKFDVIDKLRKYSSPTAGGIQSLFMSLYMNKTLDLANQLLGMIFQGQYRLLEYIINQDEFRMPFIGNGLTVDDISNGSTSQVCIMGMIINLVLLNQASTKYNITRLDEIDGGLDAYNRYMFVDVLNNIINILNIDQLFIISHSVESALSNVDVIQLSPIPEYDNVFTGANVIYTYK
jgi:DNA repair exonuclease SbcCD ATPase subunit